MLIAEMFVIDQHLRAVPELARGGVRVEPIYDGAGGLVIDDLHDFGGAVRVIALGFDLIPAIGRVPKIPIENWCAHVDWSRIFMTIPGQSPRPRPTPQ